LYCNCCCACDDDRAAHPGLAATAAARQTPCYDAVMANDDGGDGPAQDPTRNLAHKLTRDLATKTALQAGRNAARAAFENLTLSDDEKAARNAARARATKKKIAIGIVVAVMGIAAAVALAQLVVSLWWWAVGGVVVLGMAGVAALLLKPRIDGLRRRLAEARATRAARQAAIDDAERQRQALVAAEQAKAQAAKKLDDELARLKQQAGR
jgi:hypothetical protein